jgi:hypothetical protein
MAEAKVRELVTTLVREANAAARDVQQPWYHEVLLRRDACIAQYLWDSMRRPAEVRCLSPAEMVLGSSGVQAFPHVSKMCHPSQGTRRPAPVASNGIPGEQLQQLFLGYASSLIRHRQPLGRYLFSPLMPDRTALDGSQGLSVGAMGARIKGHLERLGLRTGESLYSLKRGAMQHEYFIVGHNLQAIGEAAVLVHTLVGAGC